MTLEDIIAQLQRIDARLDTLSDELCQMNTRVGRITRRQAEMGGYTMPFTLWPLRIRVMGPIVLLMMMLLLLMMRMMEMLAHPAMTRCLLDTLTLCHS